MTPEIQPLAGSQTLDVAVIGNIGIDTNIYLPGHTIGFEVEANFTENLDMIGQAGGYASFGYSRLGKQSAFIGYVGEDFSGRHIRTTLEVLGIDTSALFIDPAGTSRSVNFMYPDGRRKNFYDGKSHMHLLPDLEVCRQVLVRARLAHFNIPNWARHLLPIARQLDLIIACDLQDIVSIADPYRQDFIQYADILFLSAVNHPDPAPLIRTLFSQKPDLIIVAGMGARGCALGAAGTIRYFEPVSVFDQPVIDTNGAGDSLAVGFLSSYIFDKFPLEEAVFRGQIAARHACTLRGSTDALITSSQLEAYFQLHKGLHT